MGWTKKESGTERVLKLEKYIQKVLQQEEHYQCWPLWRRSDGSSLLSPDILMQIPPNFDDFMFTNQMYEKLTPISSDKNISIYNDNICKV